MSTILHGVASQSSTDGTTFQSALFTPAAGDYLIAFVVGSETTTTGVFDSDQTLNWEMIYSAVSNSVNMLMVYAARLPAAATSGRVYWDCPDDPATACAIAVARVASSESGYIRQVSPLGSGAASTNPSVTFSANCLTGNSVLFFATNLSSPFGVTKPTGYTLLGATSSTLPNCGIQTSSKDSGETGTTITTLTTSATAWNAIAVEIYTSGTGAEQNRSSTGYYGLTLGI
jgi:hypothetical protein